jgi:hypothetical protein
MTDPSKLQIELVCRDLQATGQLTADAAESILDAARVDLARAWDQGQTTDRYRTDFIFGEDTSRVVMWSGGENPYRVRGGAVDGSPHDRLAQ